MFDRPEKEAAETGIASEARAMTFVVRLTPDERGGLSGVVERVSTGAKERVHGLDALAAAIAPMTATEGRSRDGSKEVGS